MYRSIWKAFFFVLFFKPCLSTCFCLFKYSYCFYLILSHLTYKRKQMRMQTEIIISLMYSLILRETLLCWLWMPWLRNGALQNQQSLSSPICAWFVCVCVCAWRREEKKWERRREKREYGGGMNFRDCLKSHVSYLCWHFYTFYGYYESQTEVYVAEQKHVNTCTCPLPRWDLDRPQYKRKRVYLELMHLLL